MINLIQDKLPEIGQKFIAIFNDGSGCRMFMRVDGFEDKVSFIDAHGEQMFLENMEDYLEWFSIQDNVKFWFELVEERNKK